jgi:hypothetical protein
MCKSDKISRISFPMVVVLSHIHKLRRVGGGRNKHHPHSYLRKLYCHVFIIRRKMSLQHYLGAVSEQWNPLDIQWRPVTHFQHCSLSSNLHNHMFPEECKGKYSNSTEQSHLESLATSVQTWSIFIIRGWCQLCCVVLCCVVLASSVINKALVHPSKDNVGHSPSAIWMHVPCYWSSVITIS